MKVRCIDAKEYRNKLIEGKIYDGEYKFNNIHKEKRWEIKGFERYGFKKYRFEEVKDLSFKEVIENIKEGEVWECTRKDARVKKIRMINDLLVFDYGDTITEEQSAIRGTDTFKLQRKEYTFEEAFKAYEEGKEIESRYSKYRFRKENEADLSSREGKEWYQEGNFEIDEIRGKWYIND